MVSTRARASRAGFESAVAGTPALKLPFSKGEGDLREQVPVCSDCFVHSLAGPRHEGWAFSRAAVTDALQVLANHCWKAVKASKRKGGASCAVEGSEHGGGAAQASLPAEVQLRSRFSFLPLRFLSRDPSQAASEHIVQ